ncbi:GGDEF domain-containing protein, partial [Arthrospira platensis SPKY1]|nr:GGDEF domain-containing protein [Arthrospira platensis SPKY1]
QGTLVVAVARSPRKALEQWTVLLAIGIATVVLASLVFSLGLLALHRMQDRTRTVLAREEYLRQKAEEEIRHMAFYDALTKLPNRRMLYDRLEQMLAASVRRGRYSA